MRLSTLRTPLLLAIAFAVLSSPLAYRLTRDMFGAWVSSAAGCSTPSGVALHALVFLGVAVALALSSTPKEGFPSPPQGPLAIPRPALFNRFTRRHRTKASKATLAWAKGMPRTQEIQTVFTGLDQDLSNWLQTIPSTGDGSYMVTKMMYIQNPKIYSGNFAGKKLAGFTYLYVRYEGSMNGEALWFVPTLCAKGSTSGCTQGRMRVALYGGKPQILDMKDKNVTRMVPSKVSSAPITTRTPSGSYVPDPSEYKVSPPPAAGTTYTFIPADTTPPPTAALPSTYDGPLAINVRRAPIQGYDSVGTLIKLSKPRYWVSTGDFDQLFNFVTRDTNIYFQNQADGVWYKLYATGDVAMSFTPGKEMYSTVVLYKHDGKSWIGIPPLKNYNFVMTKIKTSSDPTLLIPAAPTTSVIPRSSTQDINKKIGTTGGAIHPMTPSPQVITVSTGQSPGSLITAPDDFFPTSTTAPALYENVNAGTGPAPEYGEGGFAVESFAAY